MSEPLTQKEKQKQDKADKKLKQLIRETLPKPRRNTQARTPDPKQRGKEKSVQNTDRQPKGSADPIDFLKAYDTTWKYGIMNDLYEIGLKGRLPIFVQNFLSNREFKVRVGSTLSEAHNQEQGVPQGSICNSFQS